MMSKYSIAEKITNTAVLSRLALIFLQVIFNFLCPDHDASVFISPPDPTLKVSWGDLVVDFLFGGMVRWDAQYFVHIAQYGYTHENTLAFFPLYPLMLRGIGTVLHVPMQFILNYHSCILVGALGFNLFLFAKTAIILYKLTREVMRSETLAYRAALLFCFNPASIFFSAPYSECFYTFLCFSALLSFEMKSSPMSIGFFSIASGVRSNGLINMGFIIHRKLQECLHYFHRIRNATTDSGHLSLLVVLILTFNFTLIPVILGCLAIVLPFAAFQFWCFMVYCVEQGEIESNLAPHLELFLRTNFLHSPDLGEAEWCFERPPIAYSHVQEKYWEVGLLRYYEMRQIPNFLLALPVVMTVICHAALYMVDNSQVCWHLGIPLPKSKKVKNKKDEEEWCNEGINSWKVFVYTAHSLALCIFCVLCIHVQVTTRLICSSSPVIYWFTAHLLTPKKIHTENEMPLKSIKENSTSVHAISNRVELAANLDSAYKIVIFSEFPKNFWAQVVLTYFLFYFVLGTALFSNFFPWT